jgi:hypothetical protein
MNARKTAHILEVKTITSSYSVQRRNLRVELPDVSHEIPMKMIAGMLNS